MDNLSELERFLLIMCETDIDKCRKLAKGNKIMEEFIDEAIYVSQHEILEDYNNEVREMQEMKRQGYDVGRNDGYDDVETGERNKQLEIARNLLNNNVSIDIIINSTGLTKEEIESL